MKRSITRALWVTVIVAACWVLMTLAPVYFLGGFWGTIWFILHLPLSDWMENRIGIGPESYLVILTITGSYAVTVGIIAGLISMLFPPYPGRSATTPDGDLM